MVRPLTLSLRVFGEPWSELKQGASWLYLYSIHTAPNLTRIVYLFELAGPPATCSLGTCLGGSERGAAALGLHPTTLDSRTGWWCH